jgi:hypothetical protein
MTLIYTARERLNGTASPWGAITGTTLLPGDRIILKAVEVIQDSGGSNITGQVNSVRLS